MTRHRHDDEQSAATPDPADRQGHRRLRAVRRRRGGPARRRPLRHRRQPRGEGPEQRRDPTVDVDRPLDPSRPDRVAHRAAAPDGSEAVVRHLLQRLPGVVLAALDDRRRGHPHRAADGPRRVADGLQVDGQRPQPAGRLRDRRPGRRVDVQLRAVPHAVRRRRLVLVRRRRGRRGRRRRVGRVDRRGPRRPRAARHRRHRDHHHEPPRLLRQADRPDRPRTRRCGPTSTRSSSWSRAPSR